MASERAPLYLRGMPVELVREAKAAAARRGSTLAAFVSDAVSRSLVDDGGERGPEQGELRASMRWFERHRARLLERYPGEYLAIVGSRVIDHGKDFEVVAARVFSKLGARPVFMPRVQEGPERRRVRSPRLRP